MITAAQSKTTRKEFGLTQKQVSESIGICNTDISKFECGRLALTPKELTKLEAFYEEKRAERDTEKSTSCENNPLVTVAGFEVPEGLSKERLEFLTNSYLENQALISETLNDDVEKGFFGDIKPEHLIRNLLVPMAESLILIQTIIGHTDINLDLESNSTDINQDNNVKTYRDAIEHMIATPYAPE